MKPNLRSPSSVKEDLRAMLDQLAIASSEGYWEGVAYAKREIKALEQELLFIRYKRTDVLS